MVSLDTGPNVATVYTEYKCAECKNTFRKYSLYIDIMLGKKRFCSYNCRCRYIKKHPGDDGLHHKVASKQNHSYKAHPRAVLQCSRNTGEVIRRWESITSAAEYIGCSEQAIHNVVSGRNKTAGGFSWKYERVMQKSIK